MTDEAKASRNRQIATLYEQGAEPSGLAVRFSLSREWIYNILKAEGIALRRRKEPTQTFLGISIDKHVKKALNEEARRRGISTSSLSNATLSDMLIACGYPVEAEAVLKSG